MGRGCYQRTRLNCFCLPWGEPARAEKGFLRHLCNFLISWAVERPNRLDFDLVPCSYLTVRIQSQLNRDALADGWRLADFQGKRFRDFGAELRAELVPVISEDRRLVAGAGDGKVAKAGVEQIRVDSGIGVDQDALGGESLVTVAGNDLRVLNTRL